jgi:hypothetical protein
MESSSGKSSSTRSVSSSSNSDSEHQSIAATTSSKSAASSRSTDLVAELESIQMDSNSSLPKQFLDSVPPVARRVLLAEHERSTAQAKREMEASLREKQQAADQFDRDLEDILSLADQPSASNYFVPSSYRVRSATNNNSGDILFGHAEDDGVSFYDINQQDFDIAVDREKLLSAVTTTTSADEHTAGVAGAGRGGRSQGSSSSKRSHDGNLITTRVVRLYEPEILRPSVYVKFVQLYKTLFNQHDSNELMNSLYYPCCNQDMVNMRKFWIRIPLSPLPTQQAAYTHHGHQSAAVPVQSLTQQHQTQPHQFQQAPPRLAAQMVHCAQITGLQNVKENMKVDFMTHPDCVLQIQETRVFYGRDGCVRSASRFIFTATKITYHPPQPSSADSLTNSSSSSSAAASAAVSDDERETEPEVETGLGSASITTESGTRVTMEEVNMEGYFMVHYDKQNRVCQVETNIFKSLG